VVIRWYKDYLRKRYNESYFLWSSGGIRIICGKDTMTSYHICEKLEQGELGIISKIYKKCPECGEDLI